MFSSYHKLQMQSNCPWPKEMLNDASDTVPNGALSGRQVFDLYVSGDRLPSSPATPKYDDAPRHVTIPRDLNEALSLAGEELAQLSLPPAATPAAGDPPAGTSPAADPPAAAPAAG